MSGVGFALGLAWPVGLLVFGAIDNRRAILRWMRRRGGGGRS
jgi:hypothetical protein